ncbi:MAG: endolytic transglycosylase MltG [Ferrimicrobium sp.]
MTRVRMAAIVAVAMVLAVVIGIGLIYVRASSGGSGGHSVAVLVRPGTSVSAVSQDLSHDHIIENPLLFDLFLRLHGEPVVDAGVYLFQTNSSYSSVLGGLINGPTSLRLTVLSGMTLRQISSRLAGVPGAISMAASFTKETHNPIGLTSPFLPTGVRSLEGLLYPDTYFVDPLETPTMLIQTMLNRMTQEAESVGLQPTTRIGTLSAYQILVGASIIEHEAKTAVDYPKVARVIYNRIAAGMPLQMDSTVRFATGNAGTPLTVSELHSHSIYNTYTHVGLPPTPIGAVSTRAIRAMLHPTPGPWLYFVALKGHANESFFSTFAEQAQAIAATGMAS